MNHNDFMHEAVVEARKNAINLYQHGGPFGAVIVKDGNIIARAHNTSVIDNDPTAHAEINAIREACKKINSYDLSGCILYVSSEPCPMCLSAIIWSNIKTVYYANTKEETGEIGFRDDVIYDYFKGKNEIIKVKHLKSEEATLVYEDFMKNDKKVIY